MKSKWIIFFCMIILSQPQALAENIEEPESSNYQKQEECCPQANEINKCNNFLCTQTEIETIFKEVGLSDSQICTARKLQEKYELETLSVNDRLLYEENVLNEYNATCANNSDKREQRKKIRNLKRTKNDICKCYEKQFKVMLSNAQWKEYKKYRNK